MMIMGLSMTVVNLTDTAFLGQLGPVELGGAGNAGLTYMLLIMIGSLFCVWKREIVIHGKN